MEFATIAIRLLLTFALSVLFGIDRQRSHKLTGFGTYTYVAVGTCAMAIVAVESGQATAFSILGYLLTGIGFLGAGALVRNNDKTYGFTTASGIWIFAIWGILVGLGEYPMVAILYAIIWVIILVDKYLERRGLGSYMKKLSIKTNSVVSERELRELIIANTTSHKLKSMIIDKKEGKLAFVYLIEGTKEEINKIPNTLYQKEWFESCQID